MFISNSASPRREVDILATAASVGGGEPHSVCFRWLLLSLAGFGRPFLVLTPYQCFLAFTNSFWILEALAGPS